MTPTTIVTLSGRELDYLDPPSKSVTDKLHLKPLTFHQAYNLFMERFNDLQPTV